MKTTIGIPARKEDYFLRPHITEEIWSKIETGSNLLFVAPRRVGKSSILLELFENPKNEYLIVYEDTEPINSSNEFYKKLFNRVNEKLSGIKKYKNKIADFTKDQASRIESFSIADGSIKFGESRISYENELEKILTNLALDRDRIIILVDEFSQTVENIIKDVSESAAINFLESNSRLRTLPQFSKRIQFIYAGSIGLENVVSHLNGIKFIDDLTSIVIPPLTKQEARALVNKIFDGDKITFDDKDFEYLLIKIEWLIPFYFQLILDECGKILRVNDSNVIDQHVIDSAIKNSLKHRIYFENWYTRLRTAFKGEEFSFVKDVLNLVSTNSTVPSNELFNLAVKCKLENSYNNLLNTLKHDGYINNNDDPKIYRFNSPLLKEWWYCNVAN